MTNPNEVPLLTAEIAADIQVSSCPECDELVLFSTKEEAALQAIADNRVGTYNKATHTVVSRADAERLAADDRDLDEMLIVRHLSPRGPEESLRSAIDRLLNWEVAVSLDPRVSSEAEALVQKGRDESAERLARVGEVAREMRRVRTDVAQMGADWMIGPDRLIEWADRLSGKE